MGVLMQLAALYLPPLQSLLGTVPIVPSDWITIAVGTAFVSASIEAVKYILVKILGTGKFQQREQYIS
jgi:hypothetical protein